MSSASLNLSPQQWEARASSKRLAAAALIPPEWSLPESTLSSDLDVRDVPRTCGILTEQEVDITESYDACTLLQKLAEGTLSSIQVTTAFAKRAAIAQQLTACLTETFFPQALQRAAELDQHFSSTGKTVGPLHGLPISLKDSFNVIGVATTLGMVSFLDHPLPTENAALVQILLAAGAVIYVKTNVPQTMMTADTDNNLFGRTLNPCKLSLGAGGSSGGEGALVAMRGSPIGIGTDIAGSIRIPALCCGTVGFKPTVGRVPYGGQKSPHRGGVPGILPSAGPLAHSVRDAALLLKTIFNAANVRDLDDSALPVPWRLPSSPTAASSKLRIGLLTEDAKLPMHPPMQRVLCKAVEALKDAGHELIDITEVTPKTSEIFDVAYRFFDIDPTRTVFKHLKDSGEPETPSVVKAYSTIMGDKPIGLTDLFSLNVARASLKARLRQIWAQYQLDVILCPAYQGGCAQPHDAFGNGCYTVPWNFMDACYTPIPFY